METKEKKSTGSLVIIVLLAIALLGSVGYIVYDKFFMKDNGGNNNEIMITEADKTYALEFSKNARYYILQDGLNENNVITLTDSSKLQLSIKKIIDNLNETGIEINTNSYSSSDDYCISITKAAVDNSLKNCFVDSGITDYSSANTDNPPYRIEYTHNTDFNKGDYRITAIPYGSEGPNYDSKTVFYDKTEVNSEDIYVYMKSGYYSLDSEFVIYSDKGHKNKIYSKAIDQTTMESELKDYDAINAD